MSEGGHHGSVPEVCPAEARRGVCGELTGEGEAGWTQMDTNWQGVGAVGLRPWVGGSSCCCRRLPGRCSARSLQRDRLWSGGGRGKRCTGWAQLSRGAVGTDLPGSATAARPEASVWAGNSITSSSFSLVIQLQFISGLPFQALCQMLCLDYCISYSK